MTDLLSPEDTGEIVVDRSLGETTDLTRYYAAPPRSPLPRPDLADTIVEEMPQRARLVVAEDFQPPTSPDVPRPSLPPVPPPPTPQAGVLTGPWGPFPPGTPPGPQPGPDGPNPGPPPPAAAETERIPLLAYRARHRKHMPRWVWAVLGAGASGPLLWAPLFVAITYLWVTR